MKNHSCHTGCTNGLASICGTSIDLDDLNFAQSRNHLVYVNKVFSKGQGTASPLVFNLTTSPAKFQTQLLLSPLTSPAAENLCEEVLGTSCRCHNHDHSWDQDTQNCVGNTGCNCNCNCNNVLGASTCQLDENAVFEVLKSHVRVTAFNLANPSGLSPNQVTVDGFPVDSLFNLDGSFEATLNSSLPNIIKPPCAENGLPTKAFFLISCVGPWVFQAEFVIEGTVNTNGNICCFRAIFRTLSTSPICANIPVSNIAVDKISVPCVSGGMSPRIVFSFGANMSLLNPVLTVVSDTDEDSLFLVLSTPVVVEPTVDVQVIKQALLCINACEAIFPCEGTESAVEEEEEEAELDQECHCGTNNDVESASNNFNCGNTIALGTNSTCSRCLRGI
ncbi:hypothetical protein [Aminipila terrae]|uniref:Uncharacterized protein n=1 Tax=Aminipila terrae TaxID=2697030 RepID=A0A6P1MLT7_9FIRM|nr:hypothetical protein [Aminipila terrae]QHI73038.1 hypothetical protein Ami3637_12060 [Aminipila terrae]